MTLSPLSGGLLAAGVFLAASVAWRMARTKRRVAGASGPKRFQRPQNSPWHRSSRPAPKNGLRAVAIWGTAAVLIAWVALSLASQDEGHGPVAAPVTVPAAPAPVVTTPFIAASLEPPSDNAAAISAPLAPAQVADPVPPAAGPGQASSAIQNAALSLSSPESGGNAPSPAPGTFAPSEQAPTSEGGSSGTRAPGGPATDGQGTISQAALAMAPSLSRMEPIGRALQSGGPQLARVVAPSPEPQRLTAPPRTDPQTPPLSNPNATGPVSYTVLLGSFGKAENAERLRLKLVEAGLPVTVAEVTARDNKTWFRVMSGSFERQSEAETYSAELKQRNLVDRTFIFRAP
ncbi:MAG: SPOR domain-containing protein [Deltaproteobacteria bacterium]|jgi:cell division septation protein DedD|nr:SPOR domain-containing protein [Deltaproteobacteria bacterium]